MSAFRFRRPVDEREPMDSPLEPAGLSGRPEDASEQDEATSMPADPGSYLKW